MRRVHYFLGPLLTLISFFHSYGQEGNYRYESYGNQSLLLNGNVTGSAEDLGLTYYNPARLAFIEEPSIVIAGKAFQLINYDLENIFESDIDLKESNFNGIPSIFSGTFKLKKLPNHQFAYSFISRYRSDLNLNYDSGVVSGLPFGNIGNVDESFSNIAFRNRLREEWYGISWAHKLKDNFSIGASLFGSIYETNGRGNLLITANRLDGSVVSYYSNTNFTQKTYGLFLKLGMAWQLKSVALGLNVTAPFLSIKDRASVESEEFLSGLGTEQDYFRIVDQDDLDNQRKTAPSIALGAGVPLGKSMLHLSVDWTAAISEYERIVLQDVPEDSTLEQLNFNEEFKSVFNFGAGADLYISPSVRVLISFSSDYNATLNSPNLFNVVTQSEDSVNLFGDFWHFGLGPDLNFKWGKITLGATYSRSSVDVDATTSLPSIGDEAPPSITSAVGFERWRFVIGLEIPLISKTVKGLPIK